MNQPFFSFCCKSHSFNPLTKYTFTFKCTLITLLHSAQRVAVWVLKRHLENATTVHVVYCTTKNKCILNDGDADFYR